MTIRQRIITISGCFAILLGSAQACNADIIIDAFTTGRNGAINGDPNNYGTRGNTVTLYEGSVDWTDTGTGIAGGARSVKFGPVVGSDVGNTLALLTGAGRFEIASGGSSTANVELSYTFDSAQNLVTNGQYLNFNIHRMDAEAREHVKMYLVVNGTEEIGIDFRNAQDEVDDGNGINQFDLTKMENFATWGISADSIELKFDHNREFATDYSLGVLSFTSTASGNQLSAVPEPATALAIIPLFGFFAYRRRLAKKRAAAAEDEQMEVESSIE